MASAATSSLSTSSLPTSVPIASIDDELAKLIKGMSAPELKKVMEYAKRIVTERDPGADSQEKEKENENNNNNNELKNEEAKERMVESMKTHENPRGVILKSMNLALEDQTRSVTTKFRILIALIDSYEAAGNGFQKKPSLNQSPNLWNGYKMACIGRICSIGNVSRRSELIESLLSGQQIITAIEMKESVQWLSRHGFIDARTASICLSPHHFVPITTPIPSPSPTK